MTVDPLINFLVIVSVCALLSAFMALLLCLGIIIEQLRQNRKISALLRAENQRGVDIARVHDRMHELEEDVDKAVKMMEEKG